MRAFTPSVIPSLPTIKEIQENQAEAQRKVQEFRSTFQELHAATERAEPPLAIPVRGHRNPWMNADDHWQSYAEGWAWALFEQQVGQRPNEAVIHLEKIFQAYEQGNAKTFNDEVAKYRYMLEELDEEEERERETRQEKKTSTQLSTSKLDMEAWFNHYSAFHVCIGLYLIVFFVALIGILTWALGWNPPIQRVAFWVTLVTFIVHTIALWMRMEISGRPPVTNLYSSAVFIGWACVMAGMVFELVFRLGLGNIISSVTGFATLLIAHGLAGDGDTLKVLIAVLDTQFWLSTHVICVTIGYAATYLAGLLGLMYIIIGISSPLLAEKVGDRWTVGKVLTTLIYGVVCFAVFFSLVGTVLGGLWADDSWGRFWGWDPKENGALIIVFWNVLVLHARWGGMIKDRGLAVLAIWGIVAT